MAAILDHPQQHILPQIVQGDLFWGDHLWHDSLCGQWHILDGSVVPINWITIGNSRLLGNFVTISIGKV